ncbi:MAG: hypothetical protein AAF959_01665 [Cyanobacteria bacterium P01_D01_bin.56]
MSLLTSVTHKLLPELGAMGAEKPFEDKLDFRVFVESPQHGAVGWLLSASAKTLNLAQTLLVVPVVIDGIHQHLTQQQATVTCDQLQYCLMQLKLGHKLRFEYRITPTRSQVDASCNLSEDGSDIVSWLGADACQHDNRLTQAGLTSQIKIVGLLRLPLVDFQADANGKLEQVVSQFKRWCNQLFVAATENSLEQAVSARFDAAVQYQSLWSGFGMRFMNTQEALAYLADSIGGRRLTAPPQRLLLHPEYGFTEQVCDNAQDPRGLLFHMLPGGAIEPGRGCVTLTPHTQPARYIAVMRIESLPQVLPPPQGLSSFLPDLLAQTQVTDIRVITEFSSLNTDIVDMIGQKLAKQSINALEAAEGAGVLNAKSQDTLEQSADLLREIAGKGAGYVQTGGLIVVERGSPKALNAACQRLEQGLGAFFRVVREHHIADKLWLQSLPFKISTLMCLSGTDLRLKHQIQDAIALCPLAKPQGGDKGGVVYHTQAFGQRYALDIFRELRHLLMIASTRSGKTNMLVKMLLQALALGKAVLILDYVRSGGAGTFDRLTDMLGGAYIDTVTQGLDILAFPWLGAITNREQQRARLSACKDSIKAIVRFHLLGRAPDKMTRQVLDILIEAYWAQTRAEQLALSPTRPEMTSLSAGFFDFCQVENIKDYGLGPAAAAAVQRIRAAYLAEEHSPFGRALFRPATLDICARLQTFPIKDGDDDQAALAALVATFTAQRQAYAAEDGALLIVDEGSVQFNEAAVAHMLGRFYALGLGMDLHCVIATQDAAAIVNSPVAAQILANTNTILVGRTEEAALATFVKEMAMPPGMIRDTLGYHIDTRTLSSQWLIVDSLSGQRQYTPARFYCPPSLLAITASNPEQTRARKRLMTAFSHDPVAGLQLFAEKLTLAIQTAQSIEMLVEAYLSEHFV